MEARSGRGDDVAVRLLLDQLHRLLLLQDQEAVELCSCLLLVVVPAQIQQADRLSACFGHHPLWQRERERESGREGSGIFTCLHSKMYFELIVACLSANIDGSRKVLWTRNFNRLSQSDVNIYILEGHGASAGFFCSTSSPPGPGLLPEPPPPDTEKHSYKH